LPSAGHKQIPFLSLAWPHALDANVFGGRLRAGGVWRKGIGMHSDARLAYNIPPGARRFQAEAALDDLAEAVVPTSGLAPSENDPPRGSAIFRVLLQDRQGAWTTAFESPTLRSGDEPLAISIDLAGAARLALIVDSADRGQVRDYANWLNARLVK
jgi:hypothetical protein